jgi:16S rRNA processing protein RimM
MRFDGIANREAAAALTNGQLWADESVLPDPGPNVAYAFQLVGLRVEDQGGRVLGTLTDLMTAAANPIYVVNGEREWLIPATPEVVKRVDLAGGVITVALPAGLEEL